MSVQPTGKVAASAFDRIDPPDTELELDCVHCGFCLPTCPTYLVLGNEMDSPRGRIYLIRAASEGKIGISDHFVKHMNLCLLCRACETACPSGVKFGFLMESARGQVERHHQYSPADRRFRNLILHTFTNLRRLRVVTGLLRFYQRSGLQKLVRASRTLRLFGRLGKMEALLPAIPRPRLRKMLPEVMPAKGEKRGRVGLLAGCVQRFFFAGVNSATARVLSENGYEVVVPRDQGCCGSLLVHEGEREQAKALARRTIDIFERAQVDLVVVNAAGCGSVMKEYWELLHTDPAYAQRAEAFSKRVRERVRQQPRTVLKAIPGLQLVELKESDFCCGSAGIYNLLYPELAQQFLDRKIERIKETGAEVVVSGNPGCSLQIEKGLKERGLNIRVVHPVELLDWSYRGTDG